MEKTGSHSNNVRNFYDFLTTKYKFHFNGRPDALPVVQTTEKKVCEFNIFKRSVALFLITCCGNPANHTKRCKKPWCNKADTESMHAAALYARMGTAYTLYETLP